MAERVRELREILYDPHDVPSPVFAGIVLWVALFFFPLPLLLLIHWWLHQQPETTVWLRLVSAITGLDWRVAVAAAVTSGICLGLAVWLIRNLADPNLIEFVQSITDRAGLERWQREILWIAPAVIVPLVLFRKAGIIELALLAGVESALAATKRIERFPREEINLVPADLAAEVEQLRKLQGDVVTYSWSFAPIPERQPENFSLQIAFNPSRLGEVEQRPRQRETESDWIRFIRTDLGTPEVVALAAALNEIHEERKWTPFQRCRNVLALLESFEADEKAEKPKFALETFYERCGSAGDVIVAAITLLKALKETVPEVVLVMDRDRRNVGLEIAGAEDMPESFQGFTFGGRTYFFVALQMVEVDGVKRWRWSWQPVPERWHPITVLNVG
ncbi:MAG: hypothetical protein HZRFUVUK_001921 [Candidatus Fervidibacterota bacterium]